MNLCPSDIIIVTDHINSLKTHLIKQFFYCKTYIKQLRYNKKEKNENYQKRNNYFSNRYFSLDLNSNNFHNIHRDNIDFAETSNPQQISFFIKTTSFLDVISMSKVTAKIYLVFWPTIPVGIGWFCINCKKWRQWSQVLYFVGFNHVHFTCTYKFHIQCLL